MIDPRVAARRVGRRPGRWLAAALVLGSSARCAHEAKPGESALLVFEAPPPERTEEPPPAPSRDAVWAEGHWRWEGAEGFQWTAGRWLPPRPGHVYVQAHWERRGRGWVYVPGRFMPVGHRQGVEP